MNIQHSIAIFLRHLYVLKTDVSRILSIFYWPLLNLLTFGYLGMWLQQEAGNSHYEQILIFSIILWEICTKTGVEMAIGLMEEVWSYNLGTIFTSPLKVYEWLLGIISFAGFVALLVCCYCTVLVMVLYGIRIGLILKLLLIFGPPLFISGIFLGSISLMLLIYFGKRISEIVWIIAWGISPLSGVFYPVDVLPTAIQKISLFLPMGYVFKALRLYIQQGVLATDFLLKAYALAFVYAICGLYIFFFVFNKSKNRGLFRLYD